MMSMIASGQYPHVQRIRFNLPVKEPAFSKAIQDRKGFIWLGSDQGLYRFDGLSFQGFFLPSDTLEFKISALFEAPDGVLWIGCKNGRIYHLAGKELSLFEPEEGTAGIGISDIIADTTGVIWWSTYGEGVYYYASGRVFNINHEDGLSEDYVYDLELDDKGVIWAGTDGGITSCRQEGGRKIVSVPEWNKELPDPIVRIVRSDPSGNLWLGFYDSGPGYVNPSRSGFILPGYADDWAFGPASDVQILQDDIWVSTLTGNLIQSGNDRLLQAGEIDLHAVSSFSFGKISDLLPDSEGNVWILSTSGIYRTTGSKLIYFNNLGSEKLENIHAILYDPDHGGNIWTSVENGLLRSDLQGIEIRRYLESKEFKDLKVTCLNKDIYGFIWAGTFNYGVFRIDPESGRYSRITEKEGLINNNVLGISFHNDTLWLATLGGATELILSQDATTVYSSVRSFNKENGLVSNYIYSVYEDNRDRIWFATDGDGISVLEKGKFTTFGKENGFGDDVIYSITGDHYGNIWIATASDGIYRFDGEKFNHYGIEEGLNGLQITGMTTSGEEVVVIMDNGLDVIHIKTGRIVHFGQEVNLADISPDLNVCSKDPEGNIWIGTKTGIIRYQPGICAKSSGPLTVLEEMSVFLQPVEMENNLALKSNKNYVSFSYSGIWLSNPERVSFQVMLEGYDLDWKNTYDRLAVYSSLPPGSFTFRVRSSANQFYSNSHEASFSFRIRKPFWVTPWFAILVMALLVSAIYFFIRYREKRLRQIEQEKKEKVEFEFQMLKNQVNPHFLFNSFSTLISLIEEKPSQAVEYTEKLSDFFRIILQLKEEELIPLSQELVIIEDYYFLLKKRFGNNLEMKINLEEGVMNSVMPPMTLQILVENAVKHNIISKDKPLTINIYSRSSEIVVENNLQLKLTPEISTGIGLENISKRYRLKTDHEPRIEKSDQLFRVILPVI